MFFFFETGISEDLDGLEKELSEALKTVTDPEIKAGGEHLLGLIQECRGY